MESATGLGTSFEVHLPCMREEAAAMEPKSTTRPVTTSASTGAILLAEDEPLVRSLLSDALRRSGYTVLEAGDGEEAMQRATEYPGTIELLVSDALMPRLSGKELAARIHARTPGLKVLFISGYSGDSLPEGTVAAPNVSFLGKPFTPNVLVDRVRDILSGSGAGRPDRDQRPQLASPPLPA
jgi:CheY-like chemotaxis protein